MSQFLVLPFRSWNEWSFSEQKKYLYVSFALTGAAGDVIRNKFWSLFAFRACATGEVLEGKLMRLIEPGLTEPSLLIWLEYLEEETE